MPFNTRDVSFICFFFSTAVVAAQQTDTDSWTPSNVTVSFRPSVGIVIGIFTFMFALTLLLLVYAKFCRSAAAAASEPDSFGADAAGHGRLILPQHRFSGIDKTVIESLPFFSFSSLRGVRDGLECSVCLSRFDDADVLRLLPKCKHAFHVGCVDRWLEAHSSCPLCRCKVKAEDAALFKYSTSSRFLFASDRLEASGRDLELFVERQPNGDGDPRGSSRFGIGSSFRKTDNKVTKDKKDQDLPMLEEGANGGRFFHKFKHKIIVSDVVFKSRWSDVNSSDLIALNSEMLSGKTLADVYWNVEPTGAARISGGSSEGKASADEKVLKIKEEMEKKRLLDIKASQLNKSCSTAVPSSMSSISAHDANPNNTNSNSRALISSGNRTMSEITNLSRFRQVKDPGSIPTTDEDEDEKVRRLWLPIAKRTVQCDASIRGLRRALCRKRRRVPASRSPIVSSARACVRPACLLRRARPSETQLSAPFTADTRNHQVAEEVSAWRHVALSHWSVRGHQSRPCASPRSWPLPPCRQYALRSKQRK
ncbi:hypothetical protein BHM03_00009543 [Ensete ventricosum]|nr:hypothetical protein BHM03_00009543 [Ensete ventricosum]